MGAAYGTAKAGISIAGVGTFKPELIMKVPPLPLSALITRV
jgi:V-type H+-transporting ATPase proteolipid subunit